jgi:hypothetical protein
MGIFAMLARILVTFALMLALVAFPGASSAQKKKDKKDPKPKENQETSLSMLSLEVTALQGLHRFQITQQQMEALKKTLGDVSENSDKRQPGKGSDKVRKRLIDLRDALVEGDGERIADLEEKLADLLDEEEPDLDDRIKVAPEAVKQGAAFLRMLRPAQIVSYLGESSEELPDPLQTLLDVFEVVGESKDDEWNGLVDQIVEETRWQLGGLDLKKNDAIALKVRQFLKKVRTTSEKKKLDDERANLEKEAQQLVAATPPTVILNHIVEHAVAELFANPALSQALNAHLEKKTEKE